MTGLYVCPCLVIALGFVPSFACCSVCISPLSPPFSFLPSSVSVLCFLLVPFLACLLFCLLAITKTLRREYHHLSPFSFLTSAPIYDLSLSPPPYLPRPVPLLPYMYTYLLTIIRVSLFSMVTLVPFQASLSFTGAASGPVLGLFLLGGLFPWANGKVSCKIEFALPVCLFVCLTCFCLCVCLHA